MGGVDEVRKRQRIYMDARLARPIFDWKRIGAELRWLRTEHAKVSESAIAVRFGVDVPYIRALEDGRLDFVRSECGVRYAMFLRKTCPLRFDTGCKEACKMLEAVGGM